VTKSKGELIYRIGAEFRLEKDLLEKCVAKIHAGYDALALHNQSHGTSIWAKVRYLERETYRIVGKGWKWSHVDAVEYHLGEPEYLWEVWNKFFYYGRTIGNYMKKEKGNKIYSW
jgi:hypothetical protein